MSIFARTGFNFDTTKFGAAADFSPGVSAFMANTPAPLSDWQINDMSNNDVGGYYQNPMADLTITLNTSVSGIYSITANANTVFSVNVSGIVSTANSIISELPLFKTHTDYLSGVNTDNQDPQNQPDLRYGMMIGKQVLMLTNKPDNIQNNSPIYGSFTSLFIKDDLTSSNTALAADLITLTNSISSDGFGNLTSNITSTQANTILSNLTTLSGLLGRRAADIAYYKNCFTLVDEFQQMEEFGAMGNTQKYLVNNLIGTDKLKSRLASG
jgi:hypothetical protein